MFGNLLLLNLKTFARQKIRLVVLLVLVAAMSVAAALAADFFLTESAIVGPIRIAVVDLDDSMETRMILAALGDDPEYIEMFEFAAMRQREAREALETGDVTAIITFPQDFGRSMIFGDNIPFSVTYNSERPLMSALVLAAANSFAEMLRAAQTGVYTTLNYADTQMLNRDQFDRVLMFVNMRFLGLVLGRAEIFVHDPQSITGGLTIWQTYIIAMYIALMLCAAFVMTDAMRRNFKGYFVVNLKNRGISPLKVFLSCFLANFLLFKIINLAMGLWAFGPSLDIILAITVITAGFAAFAAMITFLFSSTFSAGAFCAVAVGVSLFLSGGIIPVDFLSDGLRMASDVVFNTWAARLISGALLQESLAVPALACMAFVMLFAAIGCFAAYNKGRVRL
jgi:hypothetical protein